MSLIAEFKRRNVFRVGAAYAIVAWLLVEVASVVLPTFEAPEWVMKVFTFLVILGFPLALIFAWAFELTPDGIKREAEVDRVESITKQTGRKLDFAIIGLLVIAVVFLVVDKYILEAEPEQAPVVREKSIAVLPLANRSATEEDAFFVDGIHDDILTQISKISALKVISRTSVMEYRETTKNLKTIGQELGAATVLEGGVQRAGDRVRINVQLIDAATDEHLWADTYDRRLTATNIFAIQTEIATAIANTLRATLSREENDRIATVPTENLAAYEAYLLGRQRLAKPSSVAFDEAAAYFEQAIELDPDFALAYVGLARAYVHKMQFFIVPTNEMYTRAEELIERALGLNDRLGEAYVVLGMIQEASGDYESARAKYSRALELDPNSAIAYAGYAGVIRQLGQLEKALTLGKKAVELDPRSTSGFIQVGWVLLAMGRFDEALAWYEKAFDVDPTYSLGHWNRGIYYWLTLGEYGEAARWFRKAMSSDPGDHYISAHLGRLFMDLGDSEKAAYWVHRSIETHSESLGSNNAMLLLHLYQGDEDAGLEYGRKVLTITTGYVLEIDAVELLADHEVRAGRYFEARELYEERFPEFLGENDPEINNERKSRAAIRLAFVLYQTGEQERADLLLSRTLEHIETLPRLSPFGYGITDVQIYAVRGEKQKALLNLRQAIDEGWRAFWWYYLKYDPVLESLHDEPEFQAMVAEIEADMAAQLARVREMERIGELEPIPEVSATTH